MNSVYDVLKVLMRKGMSFDEAVKEVETTTRMELPEHIIAIARQEIRELKFPEFSLAGELFPHGGHFGRPPGTGECDTGSASDDKHSSESAEKPINLFFRFLVGDGSDHALTISFSRSHLRQRLASRCA